jgi:hypothetical protein
VSEMSVSWIRGGAISAAVSHLEPEMARQPGAPL